jgi:hypothetical protein
VQGELQAAAAALLLAAVAAAIAGAADAALDAVQCGWRWVNDCCMLLGLCPHIEEGLTACQPLRLQQFLVVYSSPVYKGASAPFHHDSYDTCADRLLLMLLVLLPAGFCSKHLDQFPRG